MAFCLLLGLLGGCDKTDSAERTLVDPAATATSGPSGDEPDVGAERGSAILAPLPPAQAATPSADAGLSRESAPLLFFMRDRIAPATRRNDAVSLAEALDELATFAPSEPAYANWASIAKDAADAARAGSVEGVRAACRSCHTQYRAPYKNALRARRLP
jgi:hypothetical protein